MKWIGKLVLLLFSILLATVNVTEFSGYLPDSDYEYTAEFSEDIEELTVESKKGNSKNSIFYSSDYNGGIAFLSEIINFNFAVIKQLSVLHSSKNIFLVNESKPNRYILYCSLKLHCS